MKVPFVDLRAQYLSVKSEIDAAIEGVLKDASFIGGPRVTDFEEAFAKAYGVKHVIGCGNGTDSLFVIMKMLGIGPGDEVITPANSWISSAETISQTGARPAFIDVHPDYYSLDETQLESRITPRTKAVMAVHLQGQMCAMDRIREICVKHQLHLIEDCAQAHFSEYRGVRAGLTGVAGSFSFYPGKNLGAYGDAGCIITDDEALARKFRLYSHHGSLKKHEHEIEGINSRLDTIQAAVLAAKLPHLAAWTKQRIAHTAAYQERLVGIEGLAVPKQRPDTVHTWHLYMVRTARRDALQAWLKERGIETAIHYPRALPNLPAYAYLGHKPEDFPVASRLQKEILSLPMFPEMTAEMIDYTTTAVREFFKRS